MDRRVAALSVGVLGGLGLLLLVGGVAYAYWRTTPTYALYRVGDAMKANDLALFGQYVDIDSVVGRAVDDIVMRHAPNGGLASGLALAMRPAMVEQFKSSLVTAVEHWQGDVDHRAELLAVTRDSQVARATVRLSPNGSKPVLLTFLMRRNGLSWRVVEAENIAAALNLRPSP